MLSQTAARLQEVGLIIPSPYRCDAPLGESKSLGGCLRAERSDMIRIIASGSYHYARHAGRISLSVRLIASAFNVSAT